MPHVSSEDFFLEACRLTADDYRERKHDTTSDMILQLVRIIEMKNEELRRLYAAQSKVD
jgi:hypothetical protein